MMDQQRTNIIINVQHVPRNKTINDFKIDCSSGILLKLLQQIFIVAASVSYSYSTLDDRRVEKHYYYLRSSNILISVNFRVFFYYIIFGAILLSVVHVLMWSYILRKVEKYSKYPWYSIEYIVCGTGIILCLISVYFAICSLNLAESSRPVFMVLIFTLGAELAFSFNICLVVNRKRMNLPLQDSPPVL